MFHTLASQTSWGLHGNPGLTFTLSQGGFSGLLTRTHCLASVAFWNFNTSYFNHVNLALCMPAKPVSADSSTLAPLTTTVKSSLYLVGIPLKTHTCVVWSFGFFFSMNTFCSILLPLPHISSWSYRPSLPTLPLPTPLSQPPTSAGTIADHSWPSAPIPRKLNSHA